MEINHQLRILLAEDDPNLGLLLSEFLKKKGFDVTWAQNGDQALGFFVDGQFDLCLLDVMMPKKDGFSLNTKQPVVKQKALKKIANPALAELMKNI